MSKFNNIRIASINVRTLQDDLKLAIIVKAAHDLNIDILAMQEVRRTGTGVFEFDDDSLMGWQLVWSGLKRKRAHGVAILLAPHIKMDDHQEHMAARIVSATITVKGMRLVILNVYAPTDCTKSQAAKSAFYVALDKAKDELDKNPKYKLVTLGDLNATISSDSKLSGSWDTILGHNNSDRVETNDNGNRLLAWCLKSRLKIMNTIFRTKRIHRETWRHPGTGKWKRVDYICTSSWVAQFVRSCRVFIGPSSLFDTDHRLLVMNVEFPATKLQLNFQLSRTVVREDKPLSNLLALRDDPDIRKEFTASLERKLDGLQISEVNTLNDTIATTVRECVDEVCPKSVKTKKKEPWEDETLQQQIKELRSCTEHSKMRTLQKAIKKRRIRLKNSYYRELAEGINTAAEARDIQKEFAMAKKFSALKKGSKKSISNDKLKTHFEGHFSARELPLPPELASPEDFPYLKEEAVTVNEDIPDEKEVKEVIHSFKNNKSGGTDKLKTEGLKYNDSMSLVLCIVTLLTLIWTTLVVPVAWLHASINCLYKKGPMNLAVNYRGLSIGANMSRIIAKIIINRFKQVYEQQISETQFGFRQNRSTSDGIFVLRSVIDKYGGPVIAVYIDLTAAYDHIPRNFLFRVMEIRTGAIHLVAILRKLYEGTTATIRGMKCKFDVLVGCRQGGQESPCLFNFYFDYVLKVTAHEIDKSFPNGWGINFEFNIPYMCTNREQRKTGCMRGVEILRWILYADDAVLFCKTTDEAMQLLTIINTTFNRFGLSISFKKTKTQVFNDSDLASKDTLFSIEEHVIENVREFCYVGQVITNDENGCFTAYRIARANAKFNELRNVLTDWNVNLRTRRKLLESCVLSRLVYGTQAWFPNEEQLNKLEVCWIQLQRSMVRGGWARKKTADEAEEKDYSFVYTNVDIQRIMQTTPLRNFVYSQYLKYIAHICRLPNTSIPKKLLFAKPSRKYSRDIWIKISELLGVSAEQAKKLTQSRCGFAELVRKRLSSPL